jgi:hypothetical protein
MATTDDGGPMDIGRAVEKYLRYRFARLKERLEAAAQREELERLAARNQPRASPPAAG